MTNGTRRAPLQVGERADDSGGEKMLILAIVYQALADLAYPEEHDDAFEFLTKTLWEFEEGDGLAFRDLMPEMFTESNRAALMARIVAIEGNPKIAHVGLTSDDGVMSYDDVVVYLTR